jgi:hypothetical protein
MNWVAPRLTDGLGNRLFQYASAYKYAKDEKKELVFFLPRCGKADHGSFDAMFLLFPIRIVDTEKSWMEFKEEESMLYTYKALEKDVKDNCVISGYRQSYKYFEGTIIEPNFLNALGEERIEYLRSNYLMNREELFFIHVRLGDYKFLQHHQIDIRKYYTQAMKYIPEASKILFFSDEANLCEPLISMIREYGFTVRICDVKDSVEALYCMSECLRGSIIGNSSFSYWGAHLVYQKNKSSVHIFPNSMGRGLPEPKDLYPPYGIQVESV